MKLPPPNQLIMGLHAIEEVLQHAPKHLLRIYTVRTEGAKDRKQSLLTLCKEKNIPIEYVSFDFLTKALGSESHQSFVAHVQPRKFYDVKEFLKEKGDQENVFVLMLDEIYDPQNFGALLRSAECFGVDGVAWSKNRGCDLSPLVAKTSCGASELIMLLRLSNLADAVLQFQDAGYEVVASIADPKAKSLSEFTYSLKTVLIMGSEGEGIQPLLRKRADRFITIPLKGHIQSLNVAQATAVLLSKL